MKFLPDVNIPASLGERLIAFGHSYRWVPICMGSRASDRTILQEAAITSEVILTHDTDFGPLLSFAGSTKPSVVPFCIDKINASLFATLFIDNWSLICQPLEEGALFIFEKDKLRIRTVPVRR